MTLAKPEKTLYSVSQVLTGEIELRNNNSYGTVEICGDLATLGSGGFCLNSLVTSQSATISDALVLIELLWFDSAGSQIKIAGGRSVSHSIQALQPFTNVKCQTDLIAGVNDTTPIYFPSIFNPLNLFPNIPQNFSFRHYEIQVSQHLSKRI